MIKDYSQVPQKITISNDGEKVKFRINNMIDTVIENGATLDIVARNSAEMAITHNLCNTLNLNIESEEEPIGQYDLIEGGHKYKFAFKDVPTKTLFDFLQELGSDGATLMTWQNQNEPNDARSVGVMCDYYTLGDCYMPHGFGWDLDGMTAHQYNTAAEMTQLVSMAKSGALGITECIEPAEIKDGWYIITVNNNDTGLTYKIENASSKPAPRTLLVDDVCETKYSEIKQSMDGSKLEWLLDYVVRVD